MKLKNSLLKNYTLIKKLLFLLMFTSLFTACKSSQEEKKSNAEQKPPNIILILADDLGYSDLGCYGGEINTPNLDYLAQNGVRFTQFYNTSRCCPSRASLLTGLYNHDAGIGEMTRDRNLPGYRGHITENAVTLPEVLKSAGYQTGMTGKWHVSNTVVQETPEKQLDWLNHKEFHPLFSPIEQYPTNRGFDKYYGNIWGVVDYFDPFSLVNGTKPVNKVPQDYYHTDAINDTTVAYIDEFSKAKAPFFLYVAHTAPHWPLMALPKDIKKYENTYNKGWDEIRENRFRKMTEIGIIDSLRTKLSPRWDDEMVWDENPDKNWDASAMAVHAAMVDRMDQGIGRIIEALKENGELENTLIIFLSDNGASPEDAAAYGSGFDRPSETRNGDEIVYATKKQAMPGPETTYSSIGERWSNVSNTPFRYWKSESYEGGVHTPMIAFWPKGIKLKKGSIINDVGHVMDFMPTFAELAGAEYPEKYNNHDITPVQGLSLVPVLQGNQREGHDVLFNEHFGAKYARSGDWKLVARSRKGDDKDWHLYNLKKDPTELNDLASENPDKVKQLDNLWQSWANNHNVFPKSNKNNK
jgi:arylsulfatase